MTKRPGRHRSAGLGAAFLLLLAACGPTSSAPVPVETSTGTATGTDSFAYLTEGSAADEYRRVIAEIDRPLPKGDAFPPGLPENFLPHDGLLEQGAARNQAWFTWLCAWEAEYLAADADEDPDRMAAAAAMLEWYSSASFYTEVVDDPEGGWVSNVLDPMRHGDASGVSADHRQMCFQYPTVPTDDASGGAQG